MKTELKATEWIERVYASTDQLMPAGVNPYLWRKITDRLAVARERVSVRTVWATVAGMVVLLAINLAVIEKVQSRTSGNEATVLLQEYQLSDENMIKE